MPGWILYDYVDRRDRNDFERWSRTLEKKYLAMLNRRLKALEDETERDLLPGLIDGPIRGYPHIYKLRIGGRVRLRPLLCKGPIDPDNELTLLIGATERDWMFDPEDAPQIAEERRLEILSDYRRRCTHVKVL
jgi:hypothetical protein